MVDRSPPDQDYNAAYGDTAAPPWDIGEPQPALAALVASGWCQGHVLDLGCGTGEIGLMAAARGHTVTGVDIAPRAIEAAQEKAQKRGLSATFKVGDAVTLDGVNDAVDTVLDSGLLHVLPADEQVRCVEAIQRVCSADARLAVLCFADRPGARTPRGRGLSEEQLRDLFGRWVVTQLTPAEVLADIPHGAEPASDWPRDDRGRVRMDGWLLVARLDEEADS